MKNQGATTATAADLVDGGNANRKRKIGAVGITQNSKMFHPNAANTAAIGMDEATPTDINTTDEFIDHDRALFSADIAPTPHGPTTAMPSTPAFGARATSGFDDTPTDERIGSAPYKAARTNATATASAAAAAIAAATAAATKYQNSKVASHEVGTPDSAASEAATPAAAPMRGTSLNLRSFSNWNVSSRYRLVRVLGKGSYGQVAEAYDTVCQKKVAIKKIINVFDQEIDCKRLYREIYILRRLSHPQVINLLDVIPPEKYETFTDLYLVFEFVDTDLHKLIMSPQYLTIRHIQVFLYQLLCGLKYIHSANVIHRDMKPANILLNEDCTLMICDFGLSRVMEPNASEDAAKHLYSPHSVDKPGIQPATTPTSAQPSPSAGSAEVPKFRRQLTKHVVTRWYRAPELILLQDYDFSVDMWSVGCIFAELLSMQVESCPRYQERVPLFPGRSCFPLSADRPTTYSDKLDQLNVIFNVIGTPNEEDIGSLGEVKQYLRKLQKKEPRDLREMYPGAPAESLDLLKKMLAFNPESRISLRDALNHPFLASVRRPQAEMQEKSPFTMEFENVPLNKETLKALIFEEIQQFAKKSGVEIKNTPQVGPVAPGPAAPPAKA